MEKEINQIQLPQTINEIDNSENFSIAITKKQDELDHGSFQFMVDVEQYD